ncbi:hypothetical protein HYPSUDRAFT_1085620 [Hypholoma sublateritium FD-334 SS-4]|uniref:Uncharacterized protein n=1 Tax=Hypholoma sublateritium (strain FD-334 SS-4) TaxID=945553 RepID=A0A0D2PPN8_HYPSF|nr:hypothetical protein HYPSUDRAFT_1085620 [Hypholoma sublateritium FD-334 SS-4]
MDVIGIVGVAAGAVSIPLAAVAASTAVVGISQGVNSQQKGGVGSGADAEADKSDPRLAKFNLFAQCIPQASAGKHVHGKVVVLRKGKLYLDAADTEYRIFRDGHPFSGFYLEYPVGKKPLGLVSTISRDPPELNWIYADDDTLELKYGNKTASMNHIHGSWDWTADQKALILEEWEGFVAVEESPGVWGLYYDQDDDQLSSSGLAENRRVVECSLQRRLE